MNQRNINRQSYEEIIDQWTAYRKNTAVGSCIIEFEKLLEKGSAVLDVGCGTGYPIAACFSKLGHRVTGIDISASMINEARKLSLDKAVFEISDIMEYETEYKFNAIVAFDSLWYVEEDRQEELFHKLSELLEEGGYLLFTHGSQRGTAEGEMFGSRFIYSSPGVQILKDILNRENLRVIQWLRDYAEPAIGDRQLLAVCRKNSTEHC